MALEHSGLETKTTHQDITDMTDKREYKITIGIRSYWITEEEKNLYLLDCKNPNIDHSALRGGLLILPTKFQDIVHRSVIEDSEKIEKGRWQCESGNWHNIDSNCYCDIEMVEVEEGVMRLQKKADRPLLEAAKEPAKTEEDLKQYRGRQNAFSYKNTVPIKTF